MKLRNVNAKLFGGEKAENPKRKEEARKDRIPSVLLYVDAA